MSNTILKISDSDKDFLIKIKNYFGENDKTQFEHSAFSFMNKLIKATDINNEKCKKCGNGKKIPLSDFCGSCLEKSYGRDPI